MSHNNVLDFRLNLPAEEALKRIESATAIVPYFLFTPSWGLKEDVICKLDGLHFLMRKRHWYSNGLVPILDGGVRPEGNRCRLVAHFHHLGWVVAMIRIIEAIYLGLGLLMTWPFWKSPCHWPVEQFLLGISPALMIVFIEWLAKRIGAPDAPFIRQFLETLFEDVLIR